MKTAEGNIIPYVGVSGVVSPAIETELETIANDAGLFDNGRILALGVKAVHKTQFLDIGNKYGPDWYPVGGKNFTNALRHDEPNPNTIAVAQTYLDVNRASEVDYRSYFVSRIIRRGQPWLQAIQFDMLPWHSDSSSLDLLEAIKDEYEMDIILQCHQDAMTELGPKGVIKQLGRYSLSVDYLLFDASHGTGQRLDTTYLDSFLEEAHARLDTSKTGIAVAGGLNATNVNQDLPALLDKYPALSWDAEGQLHPVNKAKKQPLDMTITSDYLKASAEVVATN